MTRYFVTRHPGAAEWARRQGHEAHIVEHLDIATIRPGDEVLGTLPINLVAELNARGAQYFHLTLDLTRELRGKPLSADDMDRVGARLVGYEARRSAE